MNKKSRKFIKVLARNIIKGQDHLKKKSLKKAFEKAVNELPESELRLSLLSNFTDAFAILRSQIEKLKVLTEPLAADNVQTLNGSNDCIATTQNLQDGQSEVKTDIEIKGTKISDQHFNFPYNFYAKKIVLMSTASRATVDQFYLKLIQNNTGMASVIKYIKEYQRRINEKSILSTLNHLLIISTGIKDRSFIKKLLYVYLTKMQPLVEKYLEEDSVKKATILLQNLHKFLYVSHLRSSSSEPTDIVEEKPYYNDLTASLLSLYIDLSVYLFRNEERKEKLSKILYNFISYILVKTPQYKYDVLLQITQVDRDGVQLILPLIKFCLSGKINKIDIKSYIKYIITVSMINKLNLPDIYNIDDDIQKARSVVAPSDTIQWLKETVSEEVLNLDELRNDNLSVYLLDNMTESLHSILIDSLCDKEGLELNDVEESSDKDKTQEDDVIVFQPDLSGFLNQDKIEQTADIDTNSLFLIDRSGNNKKMKIHGQSTESLNVSQSIANNDKNADDGKPIFKEESKLNVLQKVSSKEDNNGVTYDLAPTKASPSKMTNPKTCVPVRKIAVISPNSHDECESEKQEESSDFDVLKKNIKDCIGVPIESDDVLKLNKKKNETMQIKATENSSNLCSPNHEFKDLRDSEELAEDVPEKTPSCLATLSSPQSPNQVVSPDSASLLTTPRSSKRPTKAAASTAKKTSNKTATASLSPSPQVTSTDQHFLRSPVTHKHCPCEDDEKKTPKKKGDVKSPIIEVKSPKKSKSPKSQEEHPNRRSRTPRSLKKDVIPVSDLDEDIAIVAVTPGDKKSKHALADWGESAPAGSFVSDSEGTDIEMTPRKTRKQNINIPDLSVHLNSNVKKTSRNESSTKKTKMEPIDPELDIILVSSSSKEISSDSTITTPVKLRHQIKTSKSASDSDIIEMSGTPITVTSLIRESRRKSRSVAAITKTEAVPSPKPTSTKRARKPKAESEASEDISASESDIYVFCSDSEPVTAKFQSKRLSGQEMKAVLDQSGTKPNSSELSTVRSPIYLRNRPAVSSTPSSISRSRKVASDTEISSESRVRTRRMSESSVEDLIGLSSKDVTPSKMRKKDKTAVILDPITESPSNSLKQSGQSATGSGTVKKYSLRNR